jgi:hypothetical protein
MVGDEELFDQVGVANQVRQGRFSGNGDQVAVAGGLLHEADDVGHVAE